MRGRTERLSDEKLLVRMSRGDESALAVLFGRYVGDLADFAHWVVRDPDAGAEVVARTFARVWDLVQAGVRVDVVKAWLYATARDEALTRAYPSVVDAGELDLLTTIDASRSADALAVLEDEDLVRLVCAAADKLSPRDYSLLDLHLRRNLSAKELAAALSLERAAVAVLLSRIQAAFEAPITASLLAGPGRGSCQALDCILAATESSLPSDVRSAIRRHSRGCATCQQFTRRFAAPAAIFAGLVTPPPSGQFMATVWGRVSRHLLDARGAAVGADCDSGLSVGMALRPRQRRVVLAGAVAATVVVVSAVTALATIRGGDPSSSRSFTRTATGSAPSPQAAFFPPVRQPPSVTRSRAAGSEAGAVQPVSSTPPVERRFGWAQVKGAVAYQLALFRDDTIVFAARTREQRLTLPPTWLYNGRPHRLTIGTYHWYVWPIMDDANAPAGEANVSARLVIG